MTRPPARRSFPLNFFFSKTNMDRARAFLRSFSAGRATQNDPSMTLSFGYEQLATLTLNDLFSANGQRYGRKYKDAAIIGIICDILKLRRPIMTALDAAMERKPPFDQLQEIQMDWVHYFCNDVQHREVIEKVAAAIQPYVVATNSNVNAADRSNHAATPDFGFGSALMESLVSGEKCRKICARELPKTFALSRNVSFAVGLDVVPRHSRVIAEVCECPSPKMILQKLFQLKKKSHVLCPWRIVRFHQIFSSIGICGGYLYFFE